MAKLEMILKAEIVRLSKREMRKVTVPLGREVRSLKSMVSHLRKTVSLLEKFAARQQSQMASDRSRLQAAPEEMKKARFSPRLIRLLRKRLRITQRELAALAGVTVGAIYQWEQGLFEPRDDKKGALVALRKLGRREVKRLLAEKKIPPLTAKKAPARRASRRRRKRRASKR
jgi:DNA-binding transcriptional regulator YiaG